VIRVRLDHENYLGTLEIRSSQVRYQCLCHLYGTCFGLCPRESKGREELFNVWKIQLASAYTDGYPIRGPYEHGCVAQELPIAKQKGRTLSEREPEQIRTVEGHIKRRGASKRCSPIPVLAAESDTRKPPLNFQSEIGCP
jgi:hypothetical protein